MIPIGVLTLIPSDPSLKKSFPIVPSKIDSTSIVALSVSISAIKSPDEIVSPSEISHLARVPSSIVGLKAGIKISLLILDPL